MQETFDSIWFKIYRKASDWLAILSENLLKRSLAHYVYLSTGVKVRSAKLDSMCYVAVFKSGENKVEVNLVFVGDNPEQTKQDIIKSKDATMWFWEHLGTIRQRIVAELEK